MHFSDSNTNVKYFLCLALLQMLSFQIVIFTEAESSVYVESEGDTILDIKLVHWHSLVSVDEYGCNVTDDAHSTASSIELKTLAVNISNAIKIQQV